MLAPDRARSSRRHHSEERRGPGAAIRRRATALSEKCAKRQPCLLPRRRRPDRRRPLPSMPIRAVLLALDCALDAASGPSRGGWRSSPPSPPAVRQVRSASPSCAAMAPAAAGARSTGDDVAAARRGRRGGRLEPLALRRPGGEDVAVRGPDGPPRHRRRGRRVRLPALSGIDAGRARRPPDRAPRRHRCSASRSAAPTSGPTSRSPSAADSDLGTQLTARAAAAFHRAEDETLTLEAEELPGGLPALRRSVASVRSPGRASRARARRRPRHETYYLEGRKDYDGFRGRTDIGQIRTTGHVFVQMTRRARDRSTPKSISATSTATSRCSGRRWRSSPGRRRAAWLFATRGARRGAPARSSS